MRAVWTLPHGKDFTEAAAIPLLTPLQLMNANKDLALLAALYPNITVQSLSLTATFQG